MSDFQRHPTTGAPFIADPTTGKRRQYGRASSATKDLDDDTQLQKWIQRRAVLGATVSDEVFELVAEANSKFELDSPEWKKAVDEAVELALTKGKARIAAERGTYAHSLVEADEDDGKLGTLLAAAHRGVSEEDVRDIINGGLVLEVPVEAQQEIIDAWRLVLEKFELEVLTQEHRVVADRWRLAGTLDAIFRLGKDLTFRLQSGELVTLNKGDVICGDLKGLAVDTLIPTPGGWTTMGAITVGDKVYGRDGHQYSVTAKSAVHSKPCYLITFDNTDTVVADHDHIWIVDAGGSEVLMTTEEIHERLDVSVIYIRRMMNVGPAHEITSIERIPTVPTQCISVDSPDHTYLFGRSMIPTHNTGRLRSDGKGMPMFWDGYCGQVTAYANSVPYEPATDSRGEWPASWGEMSSDWAIIVHISVEEVLSGQEATAELILVDLNQGIKDLDLARQIKDSRKASRFGVLGPSEPVVVINARSKDANASAVPVAEQPIDLGEDW